MTIDPQAPNDVLALAKRIAGPDGKYGGMPLTRNDIVHLAEAYISECEARGELETYWCKVGETLTDRIQREREDSLALMGLLGTERGQRQTALAYLRNDMLGLETRIYLAQQALEGRETR